MAKSRGRKFAEITSPSSGVFDLTSVPTITNAKLQNSAMTLAGSSVSLGGTGVANTDALSEGSSNLYFTNARVQSFLGGGTLAGNVVVPDNRSIYLGSNSDFRLVHNTTNTQLINATGALQVTSNGGFDVTGAATFSSTIAATGAITANAGVVVDNITIDGTEIDLSSGSLTLDVATNIILDSGNAEMHFAANGTVFGKLYQSGNDFYINTPQSDEDIIFTGNDGGSSITALTLDMSEAGAATFAAPVAVTGTIQSTSEIRNIGSSGNASNRLKLTYDSTNGTALIGPDSNGGSTTLALGTSNSGTYANALTIANDGDVGIGVPTPDQKLMV